MVQIYSLPAADGILLVGSFKHQLLVINLALVPGGQLENSQLQNPRTLYASFYENLFYQIRTSYLGNYNFLKLQYSTAKNQRN